MDELEYLRTDGHRACGALFSHYQSKLERMVRFRMDQRLSGRVDPGDVLQEAYIEVSRRLGEFLEKPTCCFFVWVRQITWQTLLMVHRRHLGQKRNAGQEIPLQPHGQAGTTSYSHSIQLAACLTSPSHVAMRDERTAHLGAAIDAMDAMDREILILRHFEQLTNAQVAETLGLKKTAASNRYVRALKRLKDSLESTASMLGLSH